MAHYACPPHARQVAQDMWRLDVESAWPQFLQGREMKRRVVRLPEEMIDGEGVCAELMACKHPGSNPNNRSHNYGGRRTEPKCQNVSFLFMRDSAVSIMNHPRPNIHQQLSSSSEQHLNPHSVSLHSRTY